MAQTTHDVQLFKSLRKAAPPALRGWIEHHARPLSLSLVEAISRTRRGPGGPEWDTLSDGQLRDLVRRNYPGAAVAWNDRRDASRALFTGMGNADFADWLLLRLMKRQPWPEGRQQVLQEGWSLEAAARGYPNDGTGLFGVAETIAEDAKRQDIAERERARPPTRIELAIKRVDDAVAHAMIFADTLTPALARALNAALEQHKLTAKEREKWLGFYGDTDAEEAAAKIVEAIADDVRTYRDLDVPYAKAQREARPGNWTPIMDLYLAPGSAERPRVAKWLDTYAKSVDDAKVLLDGRDNAAGTGWSLDEIARRLHFAPVVGFKRLSVSRGDFGNAKNTAELAKALLTWAKTATTPEEKQYVADHVSYALAAHPSKTLGRAVGHLTSLSTFDEPGL